MSLNRQLGKSLKIKNVRAAGQGRRLPVFSSVRKNQKGLQKTPARAVRAGI